MFWVLFKAITLVPISLLCYAITHRLLQNGRWFPTETEKSVTAFVTVAFVSGLALPPVIWMLAPISSAIHYLPGVWFLLGVVLVMTVSLLIACGAANGILALAVAIRRALTPGRTDGPSASGRVQS